MAHRSSARWNDAIRLDSRGLAELTPSKPWAALPDIYFIGSGIYSVLHFTEEAKQCLRSCRKAFILHSDEMVHQFVRSLVADSFDLSSLYAEYSSRSDVYSRIAEVVIDDVSAGGPRVAIVVHGHPMFLVSAIERTIERATAQSLSCEVVPGVSSLDTIMADLRIDIGYACQLYDATTLVNRDDIVLNPTVPLLVFQAATLNNPDIVYEDPTPAILQPLQERLMTNYPPDHRCSVVYSRCHITESARVDHILLVEMCGTGSVDLWRRPTLYIPAAGRAYE